MWSWLWIPTAVLLTGHAWHDHRSAGSLGTPSRPDTSDKTFRCCHYQLQRHRGGSGTLGGRGGGFLGFDWLWAGFGNRGGLRGGIVPQFSAKDPERREHLTLRIIAISFFALAAFVTFDAIRSLTGGERPSTRRRIAIAALSPAIMPVLSWAQRRAGRELGSKTAVADSKQTLLCTYLSAVLLIGLVLNSTLGWWWADAGAALVIAAVAVREGINAWRGDVCCAVPLRPSVMNPPKTLDAARNARRQRIQPRRSCSSQHGRTLTA